MIGQRTTITKLRKRDRSPTGEVSKPRKLKCSELEVNKSRKLKCSELSTGSSKSTRTTIEHVKKYLNQASESELDRLTEHLLKRKKKQGGNVAGRSETKFSALKVSK